MMCWFYSAWQNKSLYVSVAGCLGYDVLALQDIMSSAYQRFSCWLFRL
ncbi:hypothetical protein [uncultured Gammaproteobacteria bacterium]|nr:hypothetical protein [uncultured Gammaproteobacteria bacterium]